MRCFGEDEIRIDVAAYPGGLEEARRVLDALTRSNWVIVQSDPLGWYLNRVYQQPCVCVEEQDWPRVRADPL